MWISCVPRPCPGLGCPLMACSTRGTFTRNSYGFPSGEEDDELSLSIRQPADLLPRKSIPCRALGQGLQVGAREGIGRNKSLSASIGSVSEQESAIPVLWDGARMRLRTAICVPSALWRHWASVTLRHRRC